MVLLLAASIFFTEPAPLEMPRADSFLMSRADGRMRLEDRFDPQELWISRAVYGRWIDDEGRVFMLSDADILPPPLREECTETREKYVSEAARVKAKRKDHVLACVRELSPIPVTEEYEHPHQLPRGLDEVRYYEGTNETAIVCAFLPKGDRVWRVASWTFSDLQPDDPDEMRELFENEFLEKWRTFGIASPQRSAAYVGEGELQAEDVARSVAAYDDWHFTRADDALVVDDLPTRGFVTALTNELPALRRRYAEVVPSPVNVSNSLPVVRIYADRGEYLIALGFGEETDSLSWSAAYWSPTRRELVAHWTQAGAGELMKTIRHEAFHQYLTYALSLNEASPWFNEGYAQYFEDEKRETWQIQTNAEMLNSLAKALPDVMRMNYRDFYDGTDDERRLKYELAWSVAAFIEKGAAKVKFEPFKNLKGDYVEELLRSQDPSKATAHAFREEGSLDKFVAEWQRFWSQK